MCSVNVCMCQMTCARDVTSCLHVPNDLLKRVYIEAQDVEDVEG